MLKKLIIENYALIDELEIEFSTGFSVITGETGAGKSILLGALGLILGQKVDSSVMLDTARKCVVEGHFVISGYRLQEFFSRNELDYEENSILRREISITGKSRAFVNDTPVTVNVLKELGDHLLNIHSQHSIITLNDANFQLAVLDDYASIQNEVESFRERFTKLTVLQKQLEELVRMELKSGTERDYFQYLFHELESAAMKEGEQDELEKRLQVLTHAEEIKTNLYKTIQFLSDGEAGILRQLSEVSSLAVSISKYHPDLADISSRINSNHIDLKDINSYFEKVADEIVVDPRETETVSGRLDMIYRLENKHHVSSLSDLLRLKDEFAEKLKEASSLESKIKDIQEQVDGELKVLSEAALKISAKRKEVIPDFERDIIAILQELGMPDARVKVHHILSVDLTRDGLDKVKFLFSSNPGVEMDDISRIASGGELSRLMLSIKSLISRKNLLPTIIFDEIDIGVSGSTAGKVGIILKKMAGNMQVIAITHLPQIAGMGEVHYLVYKIVRKGMTRSLIKKLDRQERINEIAKMIGDGNITAPASKMAAELLKY